MTLKIEWLIFKNFPDMYIYFRLARTRIALDYFFQGALLQAQDHHTEHTAKGLVTNYGEGGGGLQNGRGGGGT